MKYFTLLALSLLLALSSTSVAASGDKIGTAFVITSGTIGLTGTVNSVATVCTLPANGGSFVLESAKVVCVSSTSVTAQPAVALVAGSTVLTGTITLTGATANFATALTAASPLPVVVTGGSTAPLQLKVITSGTASNFVGKVTVKGFWLQ